MDDLSQTVWIAPSIDPDTYTATTDGATADTKFFEAATALVLAGAYSDGTHVFDVEHAKDDGNGSPDTWETVPTGQRTFDDEQAQIDTDGKITIDAAADSGAYEIGYNGDRRFLRVVTSTVTGTTDGATYAAPVLLGEARRSSVSL